MSRSPASTRSLNRLTPAQDFNVSGMLQNPGEFVLILEIEASGSLFEFAEVSGGVDDDETIAVADRSAGDPLAEQAGAQCDVSEPARRVREPDPEY